jgi:hypothetical protein
MVRRGLEEKETEEFFAARVHADQVLILKKSEKGQCII